MIIGDHIISSKSFNDLYEDVMALVEQTALYLDEDGREYARDLSREAGLLYASESMRLTTRLMQLASWLLLQRAVNEGEISADEARIEKSKVKFSPMPSTRGGPGWLELPLTMRELIARCDHVTARVRGLDKMDRGDLVLAEQTPNPVTSQWGMLEKAFSHNV